ncbi:MAG: glycosyltransferase [Muribaculaceae bacterium]|nr:glycosyltransferase [Muribaculaceae bacterium]
MISVIIPVYNGSAFITRCYKSLTDQTFSDWEAIFIDDGSTDDSYERLMKLSAKDSRVKVISKVNEGVAIAREAGIKSAAGEFVTFLDVDDTLVDTALHQFVTNFRSDKSDIVIGGINLVSENGAIISRIYYAPMLISGTTAVDYMCTGTLRWQLCGKAFRISVLNGTKTPTGIRSAEDMAVCVQASVLAREVVVLDTCLYNYVQVQTSVTHAKAKEISYDALKAVDFVNNEVGDRIKPAMIDSLYLMIISTALRAGIPSNDITFRRAVSEHGKLKSILRIPVHKALNVALYKYCHLNLARYR